MPTPPRFVAARLVILLLDTDVLVDCLRGWPAAEQWLRENAGQPFLVPGPVAMELIHGCPNQRELDRTQKFLNRFAIAWPAADEFALAYETVGPTSSVHKSEHPRLPDRCPGPQTVCPPPLLQ